MSEVNPKLITDLLRVVARYPPEDWRRLIEAWDNDEFRARVGQLLRHLATASATAGTPKSRGTRQRSGRSVGVRDSIATVQAHDPERAALLREIWMRLRERELLPTMPLLRAFAEAVGLKGLASLKRDQAVVEVMEHLVRMPREELERSTRETVATDRRLEEEYEQWVKLILGTAQGGAPPAALDS